MNMTMFSAAANVLGSLLCGSGTVQRPSDLKNDIRSLAMSGYSAREYQIGSLSNDSHGLPMLYENGDTFWVEDADIDFIYRHDSPRPTNCKNCGAPLDGNCGYCGTRYL